VAVIGSLSVASIAVSSANVPNWVSSAMGRSDVCEIKVRGFFRLRNVTIVGFYYLLFT
jgi:hypothetical protein